MGRRRLLLIAAIGGLTFAALMVPQISYACSTASCTVTGSLDDDGATLEGDSGDDGSDGDAAGGGSGSSTPPLPPGCQVVDGFEYCNGDVSAVPEREPGDAAALAPVSISDLAHFRPAAPTLATEPDGWAVVGLPANLVADAPAQTLRGTVLGLAAEVRFVATRFHWGYGDGATAITDSGGASWHHLGLAEFAATSTSHRYAEPGTYLVSVAVDHRAEYRVAGGAWIAICLLYTSPSPRD